ncbi:MAG TPA: hypothetical protein VKS01_07035, partial [Bryobacteraceae bacterium]|nr:hypothetical protein [Bryobacteraceae bacterium]
VHAKQAVWGGRRDDALELLAKVNRVRPSLKLAVSMLALRVAPSLVFAYVRRKYATEYAYLH